MPWFRCFIHGENFVVDVDGKHEVMGFYTTRYIEAADENEAEMLSLAKLRKDDFLNDDTLKSRSPEAKVTFEEIDELIGEPEDKDRAGFSFYTGTEEE